MGPPKTKRSLWSIVDALYNLSESADKIDHLNSKLRKAAENIQGTIPKIYVIGRYAGYIGAYYTLLSTAGVALRTIQESQSRLLIDGVMRIAVAQEALVDLQAPEMFARNVYTRVETEISGTKKAYDGNEHVYFVYNPDTKWQAHFKKMIKDKPLGNRFISFCEDLSALCVWMRVIRLFLDNIREKDPNKYPREVVFHLLVMTYWPLSIKDPIHFCDDLHPLVIHGDIYFQQPTVQMNLPNTEDNMLSRVKNLKGEWEFWDYVPFTKRKEMEVLGWIPQDAIRNVRDQMPAG